MNNDTLALFIDCCDFSFVVQEVGSRSALTKIVKKQNSCSARNTLFVEFQQVVSGTQNALSGTQSFVTCLGHCRETDGLPKELHV